MGPVNGLAVVLGAAAFFVVGAVWYGVLFGKAWQRETGVTQAPSGAALARIMVGTLLCELLVASTLGHLIARTHPAPQVVMMMALGFALTVMIPAIGINYLHQRKSLTLFAIDAGHLIAGMAALGGVFIALG
jgi:Protein of unknown function (DUF1761)